MIGLSLGEVAGVVRGDVSPGDADVLVEGPVVVDSRLAAPGGLFVALVGERVDGHAYVDAARAAGAVATLATRPVPGPHVVVDDAVIALGRLARAVVDRLALAGDLQVVGLTGSSGKTGTKDLLAQVLATSGATVAPEGNFNNEIGLPLTALTADGGTRYLVMEMGARGAGHIRYLAGITPPRVGLVLNVGAAHASEFGSLQDTARAKSELVQALPDDRVGGVAVLNADDPLVVAMAQATGARVVTFGVRAPADVRAQDVTLDPLGRARFTLVAGDARAGVSLQVHGGHQVSNALGAAAVALEVGLDLPSVAAALSAATARSRWRMEVTERPDGVTVVNDAYNANPDSMLAALRTLQVMGRSGERRTWAVLGEMAELGPGGASAHEDLGRAVSRLAVSRLVVIGSAAAGIHAGAVAAGSRDAALVDDVDAALALLRDELRPGDVVLVKASRSVGLEKLAAALLDGAAG